MARLGDGSTAYMLGGALINTFPHTLATWYNATNFSVSATPMGLGDTDANIFSHLNVHTDQKLYAGSRGATTYAESVHSTTLSSSQWHHIAGVCASQTSRIAYLDGSAATENTTDVGSVSGIDNVSMLALSKNSAVINYAPGAVEWGGVWNAALSADEILMLSLGVPPWRIRPGNYIGAWPIKGIHSPELDITGGGTDLTLYGSPSETDGAPVAPFLIPPQGYYPVGQPNRVKARLLRTGVHLGGRLGI